MVTGNIQNRARVRRRGRCLRRGAAAVEMAVVTPLLLMLMFGIIEFGYVFMVQETMTNAVREAARVAVLQGSTDADIQNRFNQAVSGTGLSNAVGTLTITHATSANPVETVRFQVPYSRISLAGAWLGLNVSRTVGSSCSMRKEGYL